MTDIDNETKLRFLLFEHVRLSSCVDSLRRRANARNVSFRISLRWLTYIVNSVDKTKLSFLVWVPLTSQRGDVRRFNIERRLERGVNPG